MKIRDSNKYEVMDKPYAPYKFLPNDAWTEKEGEIASKVLSRKRWFWNDIGFVEKTIR